MSSVTPDAEGSVVFSEVRPQDDEGRGPEGQSYNAPAIMPKPLARFYRGEPEVLGTTQIFAGILLLTIGVVLIIMETKMHGPGIVTVTGIPIWSGVLFLISGSLSISASVKPTAEKVTASLVMNIFSSLAAVCGVIISALDVGIVQLFNNGYQRKTFCAYYNNDLQCLGEFTPWTGKVGLLSYVLLLFLLIFCISISTSVFACRTVCRTSFEEMTVVIYQATTLNASDTTRDVPRDYTAAPTSGLKMQTESH